MKEEKKTNYSVVTFRQTPRKNLVIKMLTNILHASEEVIGFQ